MLPISVSRYTVKYADATGLFVALKMAVGSNAPGHYVQKIVTKLVDRLRASKDWLVRMIFALTFCYF